MSALEIATIDTLYNLLLGLKSKPARHPRANPAVAPQIPVKIIYGNARVKYSALNRWSKENTTTESNPNEPPPTSQEIRVTLIIDFNQLLRETIFSTNRPLNPDITNAIRTTNGMGLTKELPSGSIRNIILRFPLII